MVQIFLAYFFWNIKIRSQPYNKYTIQLSNKCHTRFYKNVSGGPPSKYCHGIKSEDAPPPTHLDVLTWQMEESPLVRRGRSSGSDEESGGENGGENRRKTKKPNRLKAADTNIAKPVKKKVSGNTSGDV